jgi:hypothetical protein
MDKAQAVKTICVLHTIVKTLWCWLQHNLLVVSNGVPSLSNLPTSEPDG